MGSPIEPIKKAEEDLATCLLYVFEINYFTDRAMFVKAISDLIDAKVEEKLKAEREYARTKE